MSASLNAAPYKKLVPLAMTALGVSGIAFLICQQVPLIEKDIFERLMIFLGENANQFDLKSGPTLPDWGSSAGMLNALGFVIFATAQTFITFRLPLLHRAFASMSLFVLCLLYQYGLWHFFHSEAHSIGFACSLVGGFVAGMYLRGGEDQRREFERNRYALKIRDKDLVEIRANLIKQNEIERRILAADLHDQVLNDLKNVAGRFDRYVTAPDDENCKAIKDLMNQIMAEIREVMETLSPSVLEHLGLGAAIEECLRRGSQRSNFKPRFKNKLDSSDLDCLTMVQQVLLYRLAQESITNICKHANATTVRATLEKEGNYLIIRVTDDGKGMDLAKARGDSRGMKYQRYRAELAGAIIGWMPGENGKGTTVEITVDLTDQMPAEREEQLGEDPEGT